jgi:hypothetical protein
MIQTIVEHIGTQVVSQLPFVDAWKSLARQDVSGIIVKEQPEEWVGIDDRHVGTAYCRLRDGWDMTVVDGRLSSAPNMSSVAGLRSVFIHRCGNEHEIARYFAFAIMNARGYDALRYAVQVQRVSTDKQFIYQQETKRNDAIRSDDLRLVMVDFTVTYKDHLSLTPECVPECHVC